MRGADVQQSGMFSYVLVEELVPKDPPIRKLRVLVGTILKDMDELLGSRYAAGGRESVRRNGCCVLKCEQRTIKRILDSKTPAQWPGS